MSGKNNNQLDKNIIKLKLIFAQSIELQNLYFQQIPKNKYPILKYYLFPKKWLDEYKLKYKYSEIKKNIKPEDCQDYDSFKSQLLKKINNDKKNDSDVEFPVRLATEYISKHNIHYPKDFIPIRQDIFENIDNKNLLYELVIGEEYLFIFDNNKNKSIIICRLKFQDELGEFIVDIIAILILNDKNIIKEKKKFFNFISNGKGIKNYYKERNIDANKIGEQIIYDKEGEEIGVYYKIKIKNDDYLTPEGFFEEYVNEIFPNDINNIKYDGDKDTFIKISQAFQSKSVLNNGSINLLKQQPNPDNPKGGSNKNVLNTSNPISGNRSNFKKSKCITINGDIYYYNKKRNNINNNIQIFPCHYNNINNSDNDYYYNNEKNNNNNRTSYKNNNNNNNNYYFNNNNNNNNNYYYNNNNNNNNNYYYNNNNSNNNYYYNNNNNNNRISYNNNNNN